VANVQDVCQICTLASSHPQGKRGRAQGNPKGVPAQEARH